MARLRRSTRPPAARRLPTVRAMELGTPGGRGSGCEGSSPRARDRRGYPAVVAGRSRFIPAPRGSAVRGCRVGGPALAARVLGGTQSRRPLFSFGAAVLGPASFPASARWPPATTQLFHALRPRLPDGVAGAVCYGYRGIEDRIVGAVQLEAVSGEGRRIRWFPKRRAARLPLWQPLRFPLPALRGHRRSTQRVFFVEGPLFPVPPAPTCLTFIGSAALRRSGFPSEVFARYAAAEAVAHGI